MDSITGWNRGVNYGTNHDHHPTRTTAPPTISKMGMKPIGDTILPPPEGFSQNYMGINDTQLYRRLPPGVTMVTGTGSMEKTSSWLTLVILSYLPIPPLGSVLPYIYTAFVAHLFFRSLLVVTIAIFTWAFIATAYAFLLRILDVPIEWPRSKPPIMDELGRRNSTSKKVHISATKDKTTGKYISINRYKKTVNSYGQSSQYGHPRVTKSMMMRDKSIMKNDPSVYWVDFESIFITTALINPLLGIVGMFLSWFSVYALELEPFFTRLVNDADEPEVNILLVMQFLIFAAITLKLGRNTLWLWTAIGVPIYILAVMAPINKAYTNGFQEFEPYLYWLLVTLYFAAWFFRDPFGIDKILEYCHLTPPNSSIFGNDNYNNNNLANKRGGAIGYYNQFESIGIVRAKDPRRNKFYFWSIDGTYLWNAFFSVTILIEVLALYKVIDLST